MRRTIRAVLATAAAGAAITAAADDSVAIVAPGASPVKLARLAAQESTVPVGGARSPAGQRRGAQDAKVEDVEVVIVTAQRRRERLQDVPISAAVLEGRALDGSSIQGVTEALNQVAGVSNVPEVGSSRGGGNSKWTIRGATGSSGAGTVGYYLDSIPFGFVRFDLAPDASPYDLDRVEVLRGPQGTLYGVSALNGVIRILTKDADLDDFELKARTSLSSTEDGEESYRGDMAVNVPLIEDKLAVRAVVGYQELGGWIDKPIEEDANNSRVRTARLKVNAQPTDQLSVSLLGWFSRADFGAPPISADGRQSASELAEPSSTDYDAYSLKLEYEFPQVALTSSTSYLDFATAAIFDFTAFTAPDTSFTETSQESKVFAQEIALTSNYDGPWQWSAGAMYRDSEDPVLQSLQPFGIVFDDNRISSESIAVFGEIRRAFLDGKFEVSAGARYFEDKVTDEDFNTPTPTSNVDRFDAVTPRVVLNWRPNDEWTFYTSYGEGFRSGLSQFPVVRASQPEFPPADPDELKNYEIGAKSSLWSGRFNLETAVYFIDWQDVQQSLGVPLGNTFATGFVNGTSASGPGFDFAATLQPSDNLTLGVTFSWNDLTFDSDVISSGEVLFAEGSRLNSSPEETAGVSAQYTVALGSSGLSGRFSASASYTSEQNSRVLAGTTLLLGEGDSILLSRAAFSIESQRWTATLFGDNLGNENGIINEDVFLDIWSSRVRPRTVGLQFEYSFQ